MEITDYVPIRVDLDRDPKVLQIALSLKAGSRLSAWCGVDAGALTVSLLSALTVSALVRVWGAVRKHGERDGDDAVVRNCDLACLDHIADMPGIGNAMKLVGWVTCDEETSTCRFANFCRNNTLRSQRQEKNRQYQAAFRAKKKAESASNVSADVSADVSAGVSADSKREISTKDRDRDRDRGTTPLPPSLDCEEFRGVWADWLKHRSEIRKPLKPTSVNAQLAKLAEMGCTRAAAALRHSIANGWQGIFEPKEDDHATNAKARRHDPRGTIATAESYLARRVQEDGG